MIGLIDWFLVRVARKVPALRSLVMAYYVWVIWKGFHKHGY